MAQRGPHTRQARRLRLLIRDGYGCVYCGTVLTLATLTVDHIRPRSRGGTDAAENIAASCATCNNAKGSDRPPRRVTAGPLPDHVPYYDALLALMRLTEITRSSVKEAPRRPSPPLATLADVFPPALRRHEEEPSTSTSSSGETSPTSGSM